MIKYYCHDVLQHERLSQNQLNVLRLGSMYEHFKRGMKIFGDDVPVILLTLAEGVDKDPRWVDLIKSHKNYKIECHGWDHDNYKRLSHHQVVDKLKRAKDKLEKTFNQEVTMFHPPKNFRRKETITAAREAGLETREQMCSPREFLEMNLPIGYVDFHYWIPGDIVKLKKIMKLPEPKNMIYILGSPRSGTTALMTYIFNNNPNILPLREVEYIWKLTDEEIKKYYKDKLKESGKTKILDKNARNAVRLERILRLFPDADYIHIIRDGRAVANSRRTLDMRIGRYDETIEKAAYEWVHFVRYILNRKHMIKNYREVRYEDLCQKKNFFTSQNYKWKINLSKTQRAQLMSVEEPLLRELGYVK